MANGNDVTLAGEEVGFVGSRAYVKEHLGDRETMALKPGHARLSAYFNYDNGTGKIRGIYLQGNEELRPIFTAWLAPFADLGAPLRLGGSRSPQALLQHPRSGKGGRGG
jgi:Zn-dependent M28 family amino/carboxypeptidase